MCRNNALSVICWGNLNKKPRPLEAVVSGQKGQTNMGRDWPLPASDKYWVVEPVEVNGPLSNHDCKALTQ